MKTELESFYLQHEEPVQSVLLTLRGIILEQDTNITEAWKYRMPCFCYKGKMFCFLWINKKTHEPYLEFVEGKHLTHPRLIAEKRSRMKILPFDAKKDLPVRTIKAIIKQAVDFYKNGIVQIK